MASSTFSAFPFIFCCFTAAVLLIFVSVSAPTWEMISFLDVSNGKVVTHFGVFGFTSSKVGIGYDFTPIGVHFDSAKVNTSNVHNLTKALILHPMAAGLAGLSVLFGLCGARHRHSSSRRPHAGTILMTISAALATALTLIIFILDMVLFSTVRNRFRKQDVSAQFGNANWLTVGALGALLLAFGMGICTVFSRHSRSKYYL
jgi:hypothetical protein